MFITRAEILLLIKFSFGPGSSAVASLAVLSSFTFSVSVVTQIIYKSHSIAKFQMNSRRGDNSSLFDNSTLCASFIETIAIHFQVPKRLFFLFCTNPAQSLYLVTVCHPFYLYFTEDFTSFLQQLFVFIFVFQRKAYFGFLFWFHQSFDQNIKQDKLLT